MQKLNIDLTVEVLSPEELTPEEASLVEQARLSTFRSYCPYSNFHVGAAIALDNGVTVCGANQENVAYPSGTCAERSAAFYAHAQYPDARFRAIAIAARGTDGNPVETPVAPCGACRQALLEYEMLAGAPVKVLLCGADCIYRLPSVSSILPLAFTEF
ncbi:MAG: cytidine deaminase [Muribaculaceae bacterium]|nr:cytidine deaminase [Muribaculaceae bacterium]